MEKRGQFYLITAVIIIAIILGFVAITNYYKTKNYVEINDLKKELEIESSKVLDYIIQNPETNELDEFTKDFSQYAGKEVEIIYIINASGLECYYYDEDLIKQFQLCTTENRNVITSFNDYNYEFELTEGIDFYFIISQTIGGEHYVVTN